MKDESFKPGLCPSGLPARGTARPSTPQVPKKGMVINMDVILSVWSFFVKNILQQPAFFIGLMVLVGYALLRRPVHEVAAGFIKATAGYFILTVGAGGLVNQCRPILVGLMTKFNMSAVIMDPYYGQSAINQGLEAIGRSFSQVMLLLLIAFVFNILLVAFRKFTKIRSLFTTGHIQVQQSALAFWIVLYCFPGLGDTGVLIVMGVLLGIYWAVGSNLTVDICQEMTEGGGFCIAHQQMFAIKLTEWLAPKIGKSKKKGASKRIEDIKLPEWASIFNDNVVSTTIIMLVFFGAILLVLGKDFLIDGGFMAAADSFFFYILKFALFFAVYLRILSLGVSMFVAELTQSFQGISKKLLPGAVPGIDVPAIYAYAPANTIPLGFIAAAAGQFLAILGLIVFKSPVLVIAGFVPMFFGDGTLAVFANFKGGIKAALLIPFITGIIAVLGTAVFANTLGLAGYGGFNSLFDWVTVWQGFAFVMKYLQYVGVAVIAIVLLAIPQIQYARHKDTYFLITDDYPAYEKVMEQRKETVK